MPDNTGGESIGGIKVTVGADYSQLLADLETTVQLAAVAGQQIASALAGTDFSAFAQGARMATEATSQLNSTLSSVAQQAPAVTAALTQQNAATMAADQSALMLATLMGDLSQTMSNLSDSVDRANVQIQNLNDTLKTTNDNERKASDQTADFADQLRVLGTALAITDGIYDLAASALEAYGQLQKAQISLTALTGSADRATGIIAKLKDFATDNALDFNQVVTAEQHMIAFGVATEQIPGILQAAANSAAATGEKFSQVANAVDRVGATGQAGARFLMTLGLTTADLGRQLDVTAGKAQAAFRALSETERIQVLIDAMQKFNGVAAAVAQSIPGEWQNLKTQFEFVMQGIGQALAPVAEQILSFARDTVLPTVQSIVAAFNSLPLPIRDAVVVAGLFLGALAPLGVALSGIAIAVSAVTTAIPALTGLLTGMSGAALAATVALGAEATATEAFTAAAGASLATIWPLVAVVAGVAAGIAALKVTIEETAAVTITWREATGALIAFLGPLGSLTGSAETATVVTAALARENTELANSIGAVTAKLNAGAISALNTEANTFHANTSAAQIAADVHEALGIRIGVMRENLTSAQAALDIARQKMSAGAGTTAEYAKALDNVEKAQKALTAAVDATLPSLDKMADKHALMRDRLNQAVASLGSFDSGLSTSSTVAEAHALAIQNDSQRVADATVALNRADSAYRSGIGTIAEVVTALKNLRAAQEAANKELGKAPDFKYDWKGAAQTATATAALGTELAKLPPYEPTLEQIDKDWAKQAYHVNRLAKYDIPDAIKVYDDYISQLERIGAPLGQIYAAEQKELQLVIETKEQRGEDATAQIVALTNIKEKTDALKDASTALGDVYVGLMGAFNDTFTTLSSQLTDAIIQSQSFETAWLNTIKKIGSEIINTLINYAFKMLKDAIIGLASGMGGVAGSIGKAVGAIGGGGSGAVSSAAAAATQAAFSAAVTAFTTSVGVFSVVVGTFTTDIGILSTTIGLFASEIGVFASTVGIFASIVAAEASAIAAEASAIGIFVGAIAAFSVAVSAFAAASATSSVSGFLGILGTLFAFEGGGDVPGTVLSLLHPQEMVLPANYANVIRGMAGMSNPGGYTLAAASSSAGSSTSVVQINLNNPQFKGVSRDTSDQLMNDMVKQVRRSGGNW